MKKEIDYKSFQVGDARITYHYPSSLCDINEVHKGIISRGVAMDLCISYGQAIKEIEKYEKEKENG